MGALTRRGGGGGGGGFILLLYLMGALTLSLLHGVLKVRG